MTAEQSEKVHFRDVVVSGGDPLPVAVPYRVGIETRSRAGYGQQGATRTLDDPCCIFQFTLQGEGRFSDDRGEHRLPPGAGFLCESHDPRIGYRYPEGERDPWEFVYMSFGGEGVTRLVRDFGERDSRVLQVDSAQPGVSALIQQASGEGSTLFLERMQAVSLVMNLLAAVLSSHADERPQPTAEQKVKQIQLRMEHLLIEGRVDLTELAEAVGMSRASLCRFYRDHTGESPYHYVRKKQMMLACQWLLEGNWTVKEMAARFEFSSASNFIRSFKQIIGITPSELIKQGMLPRI
jgi:AraC-like DNA-binding protein